MNILLQEGSADMYTNDKIYVAGHNGLVGSAIVRTLREQGYKNILCRTRKELDLTNESAVADFFRKEKPDYVFLAAARCGGIKDNINFPVQFLEDNLKIQNNIIHHSHTVNVKKLMFLGSACIYPKECPQPIKEQYLLSGYLEPTNEAYSLAKIAGIKLCQAYRKQYGCNFISVQPSNVYGPKDNYDPESSHVIAGLIHRFHVAKNKKQKEVVCWGSGSARREFIFVEDLADALIFLMHNYNDSEIINVGVGQDISIKELVGHIVDVIEYQGEISWDLSKPEGMKQRLLDTTKLKELGWKPKTLLDEGLRLAYEYFKLEVK
jgi:GDP-L-fucose synthase